jgi:predicted MPP superfamily phosphohydrolase
MTRMSRRTFLRAGALGAAAATVGVGLDSWLIEPHRFELVRRAMPLENLPASLAGRTLLQISDIHVGPRVSSEYLIHAFTAAQGLAPDFVAVTGDFVSHGSAREHAELARVLRHLPRGRLATVGSLGNHDYGLGWSELDVADLVTRVARDAGIVVLRNEVRALGGIQFVGLADFWSPEFGDAGGVQPHGLFTPRRDPTRRVQLPAGRDAVSAIAAIRPAQPTVVLSHNPDVQDEPLWNGVRAWVLAGHTHGGQVKPPFLPPPILPVRNRRYTAGVFDVGPGRTMYINRGLGHLTQVRFNCRPEMTLFTLQPA